MKDKKHKFDTTKLKKQLIKICLIGLIIILIYIAYQMGTIYGTLIGINAVQESHNETMCDFIGHERAADGFCVLNEEPAEYSSYVDCGWEKFKIEGEKNPTFLMKLKNMFTRIVYYPAMRC